MSSLTDVTYDSPMSERKLEPREGKSTGMTNNDDVFVSSNKAIPQNNMNGNESNSNRKVTHSGCA